MRKFIFAVILLSVPLPDSFAQSADSDATKNELGVTVGAEFIPGHKIGCPAGVPCAAGSTGKLDFSSSVVFGVNYARRIWTGQHTALYIEVPGTAAPSHTLTFTPDTAPAQPTPVSQATAFITPGVRIKFARHSKISPWFSFGGGWGLYESSEQLTNGAPNPDRFENVGALQWGGGVDFKTPIKIVTPIALRFEARDFFTLDQQNFQIQGGGTQHNVFVGGGFTLRW